MAYLDWKVGDKVVCVDDRPSGLPGTDADLDGLRRGSVYTIRSIGQVPGYHPAAGLIVINLTEIHRRVRGSSNNEIGFDARRFRPVQTRKTDISQFTAMLHDQRQKVPAA